MDGEYIVRTINDKGKVEKQEGPFGEAEEYSFAEGVHYRVLPASRTAGRAKTVPKFPKTRDDGTGIVLAVLMMMGAATAAVPLGRQEQGQGAVSRVKWGPRS